MSTPQPPTAPVMRVTGQCIGKPRHAFDIRILDGDPSQVLAVCTRCLTSYLLMADWQWHALNIGASLAEMLAATPLPVVTPVAQPAPAPVEPAVVEADVVAPAPDTEPALVAADA